MSMNELQEAQARVKELKEEVSELGRQHELRGRELTSARKQAAKAENYESELRAAKLEIEALEKELTTKNREVEDLNERLAKNDAILEDVAALKRLVG